MQNANVTSPIIIALVMVEFFIHFSRGNEFNVKKMPQTICRLQTNSFGRWCESEVYSSLYLRE